MLNFRSLIAVQGDIIDGMCEALDCDTLEAWDDNTRDARPVDSMRVELARVAAHQAQPVVYSGALPYYSAGTGPSFRW